MNNDAKLQSAGSGRSLLKTSVGSQLDINKNKKIRKISKSVEIKEVEKRKNSFEHDSDSSSDDVIIINDKQAICENRSETNLKSVKKANKKNNQKEDTNDDDSDDVVIVNDKKPSCESLYRRYFVTNVKPLGYIAAYQLKGTKVIDVKWPNSTSIQRYSKAEDAVKVLER